MQDVRQAFIKARSIYYAAANLHDQLAPGDEEFKLKELVCVCLTNFIFEKDFPNQIVQTTKLTVQENNRIFYNQLTIKYVELPKFKKQEHELINRFDKWLFALTNMTKFNKIPLILQGDEVFEKLFSTAALFNLNKKEMRAYLREEMNRMDYKRGLNVAKREGRVDGELAGELKRQIAVAKKMFIKGYMLNDIQECTELPVPDLLQIAKELGVVA